MHKAISIRNMEELSDHLPTLPGGVEAFILLRTLPESAIIDQLTVISFFSVVFLSGKDW